jgi:DNA-binding transcriptional LysR family regulator
VSLTEAGAAFLSSLEPPLAQLTEAAERIRADRGQVGGLLRLNAPRVALPIALTPILATWAARQPHLTVEVTSDDGLIDIVSQGFDAGIRLGEMIAQDMVAARLTPPFESVMVASPNYLDARGTPAAVPDLRRHNCIGFRLVSGGGLYAWELQEGGKDVAVDVRGSAIVTDPVYAHDLALAGVGIAYVFEPLVRAELHSKRLVRLLPDTAITEPGLFVYFPQRLSKVPKLRVFLDTAKELMVKD